MDILVREEGVKTDVMIAQGGLFQTPVIGQQVLADALGIPITVMETAGEGGPWGMAVLAVFAKWGMPEETLADFLDRHVFRHPESSTLTPNAQGVAGCQAFIKAYQAGLAVEKKAGTAVKETA
jgi:L-ribulokinase